MGFWNRLGIAFEFVLGNKRAESTGQQSMAIRGQGYSNSTVWTPDNYGKLQSEGFRKCVAVFRCHSLIAMNMAKIPYKVGEIGPDGKPRPVKTHNEITALLDRPNPMKAGVAYRMDWTNKYLSGNSYQEVIPVGAEGRQYPKELWVRRPDLINIHLDSGQIPNYWELKVNDRVTQIPINPISYFSHLRQTQFFPDPTNDWYGIGPLSAARMSFDLSNAYQQWNKALVDRGMNMPGYFHMAGVIDTEQERLRVKAQIKKNYMGKDAKEFGSAPLLEGELSFVPTGVSPKDAEWLKSDEATVQRIANAYGVPSALLGLKGNRADNQIKEAMTSLIEDSVLYPADVFCGEWNHWLIPQFPGPESRLIIYYEKAEIPALAHQRDINWERAEKANWLKVNEKRVLTGFEPVPDGDVILVPSTEVPLELAGDEPEKEAAREQADFIEVLRREGVDPQTINQYVRMYGQAESHVDADYEFTRQDRITNGIQRLTDLAARLAH